ncbi:MAG: tetratricopeptide repeat protein [Acidobacteriaceae bacterium]|nr:tetratricopeptide repeat protein [Acidobacteriaceae bacterium]MBV9780030.1 tetratricopeptide repeat protein [Acidobacteriaceae bacterium]
MKSLLALTALSAFLLITACTQSSQEVLANGNRYHEQKKYKEASILYRKAIAKDKKNAEAYYREGLNLVDDGNPFEAAKFLRRAIDLKPDNTDAEAKLSEIDLLVYSSNPKKYGTFLTDARDLTAKLLEHKPGSFEGVRLQALICLADKNTDQALERFAEANRIKPHARELVGWYAETLVAANRPAEAEALMRDMSAHDRTWGPAYDFLFLQYKKGNQPEKAEAVLRDRVAADPSNAVAVSNLASYLSQTDRFAEAEALMRHVASDSKTFPNGHEMLGDFYLRARKFDAALAEYQAGEKQDPKDALHYDQRIVATYAMMGRHDDAIRLARTLADRNERDTTTNQMYASLLLESGLRTDAAKSLAALEKLVLKNPADATLHFDLARAYFTLKQNDKSLAEALEAIREKPDLIAARILAARIYEDRGDHPKSMEQTNVVLASEPANPDARLLRARALIGLNEGDHAASELESLIQQYPSMNDARFRLANVYLSQGQFAKASAQFEQMWTSNPPDNRGFVGLQNVKLAQGKGEEAVRGLQELVQKNPKVLGYRYQLANMEASAGIQSLKSSATRGNQLLRDAAENYKQIVTATSSAGDVWLRLGVVQRELGQYDSALASFEQAGVANPSSTEAFLNRAMLLDALGRKKEAMETYTKVLGIDPENALALNNIAFLSAEAGVNLDQALTFAERAKKKYPNNPDISDTLGFIYLQKNLNPEAVRIFRQVVQEHPANASFHLHLAMALLKEGDKQGARDEADRALKNASEPQEQNKIRSFASHIS